MRLFRHKQPHARGARLCPNCGYDPSRDVAEETQEVEAGLEKDVALEEDTLKEATQAVVKETMKVLQPLMEKLQQANEELKQGQVAATQQMGNSFEQQIESMRNAAMERVKLQESKVAKRMGKLQSKLKRN